MQKISALITGGYGDIAKAIKKELEENGINAYAPGKCYLDVTNDLSIKELDGTYDILINCAGYILPNSIFDPSYLCEAEKHYLVNFSGPQKLIHLLLTRNPNLKVINIGSTAGSSAKANWSNYCTQKAALIMLTKCLFLEGVKAICISPGRTDTKMRNSLFPDENKELLLKPDQVAKKVMDAINGKLPWGENIEVVYGGI